MKKGKLSREEFRQIGARRLVHIVDLVHSGQMTGTNELLVMLTLTLAMLDRYQSKRVPPEIELKGGDEELAELTGPVAELLAKEGGMLNEARYGSQNFWEDFIREAERALRGFTKRPC